MNNKYKIGDIVVLKKDFKKETKFLEKHEIFIIWNFTCNSKFINKRWKDYFLNKEKRYEIISINNLNYKMISYESFFHVNENEIEKYEYCDDMTFSLIYNAKQELWKYLTKDALKPKDSFIKYKFNIGDAVYLRKNSNDKRPFNSETDELAIITDYLKEIDWMDEKTKDIKMKGGYYYIIEFVIPDCGFGKLDGYLEVKENELRRYLKNNKDTTEYYHDALSILLNEFEKKGRIQKRWNIDYKFKKLDPVIYRKEHSNTEFDFNKEPICFIKNRIEDIKSMPDFGKDKLFREGKKYDIFRIYKNPFLYDKSNQRFEYVNEDDLLLYKGKDKEVLKIIDNIYQKYEKKN